MSQRKITQAALAEHLDVSAASVSTWCAGSKRPTDVDRLEKMADFLGVTPGYLQFGEGAMANSPGEDLEAQRQQYRDDLTWYWRPAPRDRGRELGNAAAYAFETDIPTLARESAQNISDEKLETAPTVQARYTISELSGDALEEFLDAIQFSRVRPHLEAASAMNRKAGNVIGRGLAEVDGGRLLVIRVDDFDANGLTGPEFDRGRYMAVVRNILDSQKGETAGGSFGLGWATFPSTSQFGLVLCNSVLSVAEDGRTNNRFMGVIDLPWHSIDDEEFAGRGWYGAVDPGDTADGPRRTVSYWENEAIVRDTLLHRTDPRPGASFSIVGAYDASGAVSEIEEMAEKFSESLADNFWPAMVDQPEEPARLQVIVRAERNGHRVVENYVNPRRYQPAKVAAFEKHLNDDVVEGLDETGDVVRRSVTLRVPRRTAEPSHDPYEHEAVLLVTQASDDDASRPSTAPGAVTYLRGSHMVINTPKVGALPIGARSFHAIVLAGEAAGDTPDARAADRFLRASEPPAHNKWTGTSEITSSYVRGGKTAIEMFDADVKKAVREIIRQPSRDLSDGPEALKELIRIVPPPPSGKRPRVKSVRDHEVDEDGAWVITEATVTLPKRQNGRGWTLTPVLRFGTESGAAIPVRWSSIEPLSRCEIDDKGRLVTPSSARTATFTAITDPSTHPVGARRAKVLVDVRIHTDEVDS
ncbi:helix-turn-helix transcriptional regulator [Acidimicrobiia bacterium EGI L10123]|nr:helix-turn-helix transcriptional regulator [Acidimicrobiia bacterium EGI L10123]